MAPQQLRIGFDGDAAGWLVSGAEPGPAGAVSLTLSGLRVTVDAVHTERLVEIVVFAASEDAPLSRAVLDAFGGLLGRECAQALASRPAGGTNVNGTPTGLWEQLAKAATAEFLYVHDQQAPGLAALRLAAARHALGAIGGGKLLREPAWEALPAVMAAGRTAAHHPELVDDLAEDDQRELAAAIESLTAVLRADGWDGPGGTPVNDLSALLAPPPDDVRLAMTGVGVSENAGTGAGAEDDVARTKVPAYRDLGSELGAGGELDVDWTATSDDLRSRLGDFAAEAFAGARAAGQVPGVVTIRMPLRAGVAPDAAAITVRVHAWDGEILGVAPLRIVAPPGRLSRGECQITLATPSGAELARQFGVHVDIALTALGPLDVAGLRQAARGMARVAGVNAVLARHANDQAREAGLWRRCARMYGVAGDSTRAAEAEAEARAAMSATRAAPGPGYPGGDWAYRLLANWLGIVSRLITAAAGMPPGERLQLMIRELAAAADAVPGLASAREQVATALLESGYERQRPSALRHLREALRLRYLLGAPDDAARLLRRIADLSAAASDAPDPEDEQ